LLLEAVVVVRLPLSEGQLQKEDEVRGASFQWELRHRLQEVAAVEAVE
jgi:hypothetical protein